MIFWLSLYHWHSKLRIVSVLSIRVTQWHWNLILHVEPSFCPDQQVEHPGMLNRFFLTKSEIAFLWNGKFNCPQIQQKAFGSFLHFIYSSRHLQSRNSCPKVFCKKGVLRNFVIFTGKNLYQRLFFNKIQGWGLQLY